MTCHDILPADMYLLIVPHCPLCIYLLKHQVELRYRR